MAKSAQEGLQATENYSLIKNGLKATNTVSSYPSTMLIRIQDTKNLFCFILGYQSDFFSLLGGSEPSKEPEMFSEPFENIVARINLVLRVTDECEIQSLVKGERVCFSILQPTETLIFDFGSEIYVWSGKHARKASGRYAVEYAQHLRLKPVFNSALLLGESFDEGRADWILYRRVFQGVQATSSDIEKNEALFLANYLHTLIHPKPVMIIEGYEFTRAMKDVITENISIWMLNGEELEKVDNTTIFNNDLCYVVRWQYRIQQSGMLLGVRRLKTGLESEKETGRERVSFFYWLGRRTTSKQQGICALKLSQFDKAKKPHVRVVQGTEPPLFLALFRGKFIVRSLLPDASPFFLIQGATSLEGHAVQLEDNITHLRCHAVYLKITGDIIVIEGPTSSSRSVENALTLASEFMKNKETFGIKDNGTTIISTEKIGTSINWISPIGRVKTPRFYRIYENEASELTSPQYHEDLVFPIMQSYLSDTMLIDTGKKLWIWSEHTPTTFALRVAEYFWASRDGSVTVVLKNSEPVEFIALFSEWREWSAAKIPILPPRDLQDLMSERTKSFTVESLRKRSDLPDGLNMKNLEQYLSKMDFEQVFKIKKVEFDILPLWKQIRLKKEAGLF
uniref:HP domain-containing protein n=1 Tax=Heterorhabditis bacteriophora TaxID=37862 RepID=A0A1I7WFT8_HETBA